MPRGMWRWVAETGGKDRWFARVEVKLGEWADVEQARYEMDGLQPPFWNLPLQQDYMAGVLRDPIRAEYDQATRKMMEPAILVMIGVGACVFLAVIMLAIIGGRLG